MPSIVKPVFFRTSASGRPKEVVPFSSKSRSRAPTKARLPRKSPTRLPSSSVKAATASGLARRYPSSRILWTASSAARTPAAPSKRPPLRTVSICEPAMTSGPSPPSWPKMLPAPSTRKASPAASILFLSQIRASRSALLNEGRETPPRGSRPIWPSSSMLDWSRLRLTRIFMAVHPRRSPAISRTARPMPTMAARATMEKPMLSSVIWGMATIGATL